MISFRLDPQSGHADSYLDVKFIAKFDPAAKTEVRIYNDTIKSSLEILSVSQGYIVSETVVVLRKGNQVEGYINLFNKDKNNAGLRQYIGVDIRCEITQYNSQGDKVSVNEQKFTFYNQSQSLDSNIVPFDLVVANRKIDLKNNIPLKLTLVSDREKKYELSIRTEDHQRACAFEVIAKEGATSIELPSEIIWSDLELSKSVGEIHVDIYWTKFEGVSHMKFLNRKHIRIDNTRLIFDQKEMLPQATDRFGPTGSVLPDKFVLSDRYFVHTLQNWSRYGGAISGYSTNRLNKMTTFWHESQNMHNVTTAVQSFGVKDSPATVNEREIRTALMHQTRSQEIRPLKSSEKKEILSGLTNLYTKRTVQTMSTDLSYVSGPPPSTTPSAKPKKRSGGCGCSRKKKKNA